MAKKTKYKVKISGNVVEFWEFENPIFLEGNSSGGRRKKDAPESEKSEEYREQNSRRSKAEFRSLVSANFSDGDKFITLTFRDTDQFDIRNVKETNDQFKTFIQRLRYHFKKQGCGNFKYLAVIEFQDENKRGAVHYHLIAQIPYIHHDDLARIWSHGFIGINRIEGVDNIGAYISKYMSKDSGDPRLKGKKNYLPSRGLDQPITAYGSKAENLLKQYKKTKKEVFTDCYDSEHFGNVNYNEYNLKREVSTTKIGKGLKEKLIAEEKIKSVKDQVYKNTKSTVDQIHELLEGMKNGKIAYSQRILDEIERRERKSFQRGRDQLQLLARLLESNEGSTSPYSSPAEEKAVNEYLRLVALEKKESWDQWVNDTILS